jgi:hypothetical protein
MIKCKYSFHWKGVSGPAKDISGPNVKMHLGAEMRAVLTIQNDQRKTICLELSTKYNLNFRGPSKTAALHNRIVSGNVKRP